MTPTRKLTCIAAAVACLCAVKVEAHRRHHYAHYNYNQNYNHLVAYAHESFNDPRPGAWCGWWMRRHLGYMDKALNLARNWVRVGSPAYGPAPGVVGVMPHHVFQVVSVVAPGKVLAVSGNDGHAVRTRVRSTHNVIAWRNP